MVGVRHSEIMLIPPSLQANFQKLSLDGSIYNNDCNQNQVYNAMVRATISSIETVNCKNVCDVLRKLKKKGVGTAEVENLSRKLCRLKCNTNGGVRTQFKIKIMVMKNKISDAFSAFRKQRHKDNQTWRECKKYITGEVRIRYIELWKTFIKKYRTNIIEKAKKKVEWLVSKWKSEEEEVPDLYKGIKVKILDEEISAEFSAAPRMYGGAIVNDEEMKALMLPPKFGLFEEINEKQCVIQLEEAINKLRWNKQETGEEEVNLASNLNRNFVDDVNKTLNINNLRATCLPYNPSVAMPGALRYEEEIRIQQFKMDVIAAVREMGKREEKWSNISEGERRGIDNLRRRVEQGEIVCTVTDKSGRWSCDTSGNYKRSCMKELDDVSRTPEISMTEHSEGEREMNSHGLALLRMMGLSEGGRGDRLRKAVVAEGTSLAPYYGLRKDHKATEEGEEENGPRVRPVCGAKECLTRRVSYLLCQLIIGMAPGVESQCDSTDDLLIEFERINRERDADERWVVGSLDVVSLYPSLNVERCVREVRVRMDSSDMVVSGLQWKDIALYLRYHLTQDEIEREGLGQVCPTRRYNRRPPKFEVSGSDRDKEKRFEPWVFPETEPGEATVNKMFSMAVEVMVRRTMTIHDFTIDRKMYRQAKGGSIGLDLTGVVSDVFMCWWDSQLMSLINASSMNIIVYKRYKDDVNFILEVGEGAIGGLGNTDKDERARVTIEKVKQMAESIDPDIKVETDLCSNHPERGGRLPILDVEVWVGMASTGEHKILHSHYMKDVSSRSVMGSRSAHSGTTKRNVMVNEIGRILKNCSVYLPWIEVADKVTYFMRRMKYSGHSADFMYRVLKMAMGRYERKVEQYKGGGSMFRDKQDRLDRSFNKQKKREWYKEDKKYDSVMFVQPTPRSILRKKVQTAARKNRVKVKVVERTGSTVKGILQRSNPFRKVACERPDCPVCRYGKVGECRNRGCVYQLECKEDRRKYRGQTGRSVYERTKEEILAWEKREEKSPLWKHSQLFHDGNTFDMDIRLVSRCFGKPSRRLVTEAVMIEELQPEETMNSKIEWSYAKLNKVRMG